MARAWTIVIFAFALWALCVAEKMHIAAVSIPAYGHFMPVKGVAEELLVRGHDVTLFVETREWCETTVTYRSSGLPASYRCVMMPKSGLFSRELFKEMSMLEQVGESFQKIFKEMFAHHETQLGPFLEAFERVHAAHPVSLILMDLSTLLGFALSTKFNIPHVSLFPLTMHMTIAHAEMTIGHTTYLPSLGTAFPRNMSTGQRLINYIIKFAVSASSVGMLKELNAARQLHGVAPVRSATELGLDGLIFAPTIWGYDIPQPLCPNIVALGAFSPSVEHTPMEPILQEFLDNCPQGAIYVNFGTLAVVGQSTFERVTEALLAVAPYCVVWKVTEDSRRDAVELAAQRQGRPMFVAKRFANPIEIMQHKHMKVFVTHCGDTSVLEAIQANLLLAGIPFFADQADVCMRIEESGIGKYVGHKHHFTVEDLTSSLRLLADPQTSTPYRDNIRKVHRVSDMLGGASKAADMIESRYSSGLLAREFFFEECAFLKVHGIASIVELQEYDFLAAHLLALVIMWWGLWRCFCVRKQRPATDANEHVPPQSRIPPKIRVVKNKAL